MRKKREEKKKSKFVLQSVLGELVRNTVPQCTVRMQVAWQVRAVQQVVVSPLVRLGRLRWCLASMVLLFSSDDQSVCTAVREDNSDGDNNSGMVSYFSSRLCPCFAAVSARNCRGVHKYTVCSIVQFKVNPYLRFASIYAMVR